MDADTIRGRVQQNLRSVNHFQAEEFLPGNDEGPRVIDWNQGNLAVITLEKSPTRFWMEHPEPVLAKWFEILRFQSDFILIDSPPILASTDLLGISSLVDGVLIVARNNVTQERDFLRVESVLKEHHFEIMGTVLNDSTSPHIQYSYGYTPESKKKPRDSSKTSSKTKKKGISG
jgi:tyrosine-protein kinase Etk/Wzc